MKTALVLLVMSTSALAPASAKATAGRQDKLNWKKDHGAALTEAKKDGKYVVVHFSGPD